MEKDIHNYINKQRQDIKKKVDLDKELSIRFKDDLLVLTNSDKSVLKAKYQVIGKYQVHQKMWHWSWGIDYINRKLYKQLKPVQNLHQHIKSNYQDYQPELADLMYYWSKNNNFYTSYENVGKLVTMAVYMAKGVWFIPVTIKGNKQIVYNGSAKIKKEELEEIEYLMITDIIQL